MKKENIKLHRSNNSIRNTIEIISIYIVVGVAWIFLSDSILGLFSFNNELIHIVQTVKGFFYVIISALLFYFIIKKRMDLYVSTIDDLNENLIKLEKTNNQLKELEDKLYQVAYYDELTGLYSKYFIMEEVATFITYHENDMLAIAYVSIDNFKEFNETKGYDIGDDLIKQVAQEIKQSIGKDNMIGRLSGGGFLVLFKNYNDKITFQTYIEDLGKHIKNTYQLGKEEFYISLSAGVTIYPDNGLNYKELLKCADIALSEAKSKGKNKIVFYSKELAEIKNRQVDIANQLYYGVQNEEFILYYQPIVSNVSLETKIVEALIRWNHPLRGLVPPLEFIDISEKTGHIVEMTWYVIKEAFIQNKKWQDQGYNLTISINLSAKILLYDKFISKLELLMDTYKIEARKFIFEITESVVIDNFDRAVLTLNKIKSLGFRIALDDFGIGYSSLTYLKSLPIDFLKIDRSFINEITNDKNTIPVLEFIINLAHKLNLVVISEGIENEDQLLMLKTLKSDYFQGYYFSKPIPPQEFTGSMINY
ncbi:MAG: bifunctional diguanylate cyclase/phosphodiesterase [Acholeplasmataceae bacterium]